LRLPVKRGGLIAGLELETHKVDAPRTQFERVQSFRVFESALVKPGRGRASAISAMARSAWRRNSLITGRSLTATRWPSAEKGSTQKYLS